MSSNDEIAKLVVQLRHERYGALAALRPARFRALRSHLLLIGKVVAHKALATWAHCRIMQLKRKGGLIHTMAAAVAMLVADFCFDRLVHQGKLIADIFVSNNLVVNNWD